METDNGIIDKAFSGTNFNIGGVTFSLTWAARDSLSKEDRVSGQGLHVCGLPGREW
jgi:hypothetical protein